MMKRALLPHGSIASLWLITSSFAFTPSNWRRTPFHAAIQVQSFMAKKAVEDVNGLSGKEASELEVIVGKKNTDRIVEEKDETAESKNVNETTESIQAEDISVKEASATKVEENLDQQQTAVDPAQSARDEEFMHLAIDAAITG